MAIILQTTSANAFSWMKVFHIAIEILLRFLAKDPTVDNCSLFHIMACRLYITWVNLWRHKSPLGYNELMWLRVTEPCCLKVSKYPVIYWRGVVPRACARLGQTTHGLLSFVKPCRLLALRHSTASKYGKRHKPIGYASRWNRRHKGVEFSFESTERRSWTGKNVFDWPQRTLIRQVPWMTKALLSTSTWHRSDTGSISWLLMPWLLTSSGHQQPWYWLCLSDKCLTDVHPRSLKYFPVSCLAAYSRLPITDYRKVLSPPLEPTVIYCQLFLMQKSATNLILLNL